MDLNKIIKSTYSMTNLELAAMIARIKPHHHVFEWGLGKTTMLLPVIARSVTTIEHDPNWTFDFDFPNLKVIRVDRGDAYINAANLAKKKLDFVIVDGRDRVACAIASIKHLSEDGLVCIHDWNRVKYHQALSHFKIVEVVGSPAYRNEKGLAILKPK